MSEGEPYWRDVGTVDAYWEANMELTKVTPELNLYDQDWPIWTYQEQLPPAKFVFDDEGRRGMAVDSMVSGGCIISGSMVRRSLLFSNVRVHSFCTIEDSVILPDVEVGRARACSGAWSSTSDCRLPSRARASASTRRGPQALPRHRARRHAGHAGDARAAGAPRALGGATCHEPDGYGPPADAILGPSVRRAASIPLEHHASTA